MQTAGTCFDLVSRTYPKSTLQLHTALRKWVLACYVYDLPRWLTEKLNQSDVAEIPEFAADLAFAYARRIIDKDSKSQFVQGGKADQFYDKDMAENPDQIEGLKSSSTKNI
jgi:hypothetical protein